MKKFILITVAALSFAAAVNAQPRAIGGRMGWSTEVSYQHTVGGDNFFEINLGTFGFAGLMTTVNYNFMVAQPDWTSRGDWGVYVGPGVAISTGFSKEYAASLAAVGQVGLEYTFWFPLQLSVDLRPQFGVLFANNQAYFHRSGLFGFVPTLSVRYRF